MTRNSSFLALILTMYLVALPRWAAADPIPEYEMKAAYLYNFAAFTEWPASVSKSTAPNPVRLCILGGDNFGGALEKLARTQNNRIRIQLSYLADISNASNCHMLFINNSDIKNAADIVKHLENSPILTVSDSEELFRAGLMIGLFLEDKRLTFDVNYARAGDAQLTISSKLLRVARRVIQ